MMNLFHRAKIATASTILLLSLLAPASSLAKPAPRGLIPTLQPDGTSIMVRAEGDEYSHRIFAEDGRELARNTEGFLVDASTLPTPQTTLNKPRRLRPNYIFNGAPFPAEGEPHALVVLVEFQDLQFNTKDPKDFYTRMLNEEGFRDLGRSGSVKDYFVYNSGGTFRPVFDVYGPVTLKQKYSYYGANDIYGNDMHPEEVCIEACQALDDEVDFSNYDINGDGYIDNIYVFYAGFGEADSLVGNYIWPHSANISEFGLSQTYSFDGIILDRYAMSNERDYRFRRNDGIGTFTHEFSHVLGLPDLYATTYTSAYTPGYFSLLDMGCYNNNGLTPPNYSLFERLSLGWASPLPISENKEYYIQPLSDTNDGYIITTEYEDEFFVLENRQLSGYDKYLPGHGMLVWHIDFNQEVWDRNIVNNTASHQFVDLIEADNRFTDDDQDGDPFPGAQNITEFSFFTKPSLRSWADKSTGVSLSNIREVKDLETDKPTEIRFLAAIDPSGVDLLPALNHESSLSAITISDGRILNSSSLPVDILTLSGLGIARLAPGQHSSILPKGIYIAISGNDSRKIIL